MRYRVRYQPASVILGRNVELALTATRPIPPVAAVSAVSACVPDITGLVWIDPSTLEETDTAILTIRNVTTEFAPGQFLSHNIPIDDWNWEARIKGNLCCECAVEWSIDWINDEFGADNNPPGYRFRWDWGILYPRTTAANGSLLTHLSGVLTVSATVTCPGGQVFNAGPITAVIASEGGSS